MKQIALYSNYNVSEETISTLKTFFLLQNIIVFSSAPYNIDDPNIAVVGVYYMFFYDGIIVFTKESDMKKYIHSLKSEQIFLITANSIINIDKKEVPNELRSSVG